jgi:hypothetical protein
MLAVLLCGPIASQLDVFKYDVDSGNDDNCHKVIEEILKELETNWDPIWHGGPTGTE